MWLRSPGWEFDSLSALWREVSSGKFHHNDGSNDVDNAGEMALPFCLKAIRPGRFAHVPDSDYVALSQLLSARGTEGVVNAAGLQGPAGMPHGSRRRPTTVASLLRDAMERCARSRRVCGAELRFAAHAHGAVQGGACLLYIAALCARCGFRQSGDPEIADGAARGEWQLWGWEGCFPDSGCCHGSAPMCGTMRRRSASLSATGANAARSGAGALHGRSRARELSRRDSGWPGRSHMARRVRWATRRHHEALPRLADQRRYRLAEAHVSACQAQPRLLHRAPGIRIIAAALFEPHHNTYDIEFWGPDGMCTSIYLGALSAMAEMAKRCSGELPMRRSMETSPRAAPRFMDEELFNGEYYQQKVAV